MERKAVNKAITEAANRIADELGETESVPRAMIWRSARVLGVEQAQALLTRTAEIEAGGGMLTVDGTRRRTPGGVYFALVRETTSGKDRFFIFGIQKHGHSRQTDTLKTSAVVEIPAAPPPLFAWADRITALHTIGADRGEARIVKITLIGRLGKIVNHGSFVQAVMPASKTPDLPKGLPKPPAVELSYIVFIANKQFKKIAEATHDAEDVIIIEGWCQPDTEASGIDVWATNVTSKKLQAAARGQKVQE